MSILGTVRLAVGALLLSLAISLPAAHAYLDPGSVGMALQVVVAAFAGGFLFFKNGFFKLKSLIAPQNKEKPSKDA